MIRYGIYFVVVLCLSIAAVVLFNQFSCSAKGRPISDHCTGSQFFNPESADHTFGDMIKWLWQMKRVPWPEWVEDPVQPAPPRNVGRGQLRVTYINQATVLIQMDGINILTDPIWSFRAGPMSWMGSKRVRKPGLSQDSLPPLDYILISHNHYDHLDLPTLKDLAQDHQPTVLVGLGVAKKVIAQGLKNVVELDWWQSFSGDPSGLIFTFVPARHDSGRGLFTSNKTLWGGFIIDSPIGGQVYFAGDTAFGEFFHLIRDRFSQIRLAILPLGSYEKRWFMQNQHMNPDDAVQALNILSANQGVGIHFATFLEHPEQAIDAHEKDLMKAINQHGLPSSKFWILSFGEGRAVAPILNKSHQ